MSASSTLFTQTRANQYIIEHFSNELQNHTILWNLQLKPLKPKKQFSKRK